MGYEIDFLAVERGEKSGDAIAFRIGNLHGRPEEQFVGIIDGGYTEDGDKLVKQVREFYGTNTVDLAVSSHPDDDHALGLESVGEYGRAAAVDAPALEPRRKNSRNVHE